MHEIKQLVNDRQTEHLKPECENRYQYQRVFGKLSLVRSALYDMQITLRRDFAGSMLELARIKHTHF